MIQVALADDHIILRKGVVALISKFSGMKVVLEAGNGQELLEKIADAPTLPDIYILDINMPVMNGYETAAELKKRFPKSKILALSMYDTEMSIIRMLRCGASGYVLKDADPSELNTAIQNIYTQGLYHSDLVTGRMLRAINENKSIELLSAKEIQFLSLCCKELTYKEIADIMCISPRTVDGYREALFIKLDIKSRTGLIVYAIKTGIFSI